MFTYQGRVAAKKRRAGSSRVSFGSKSHGVRDLIAAMLRQDPCLRDYERSGSRNFETRHRIADRATRSRLFER